MFWHVGLLFLIQYLSGRVTVMYSWNGTWSFVLNIEEAAKIDPWRSIMVLYRMRFEYNLVYY